MRGYSMHTISTLPSWNTKLGIYIAFLLDHTQPRAFHLRIKTPNPSVLSDQQFLKLTKNTNAGPQNVTDIDRNKL